jgi:hypothetical protein
MVIDKNEVLRYLGYRGQNIDVNIESLLEECINELHMIYKEKNIYNIFNIERHDSHIILKDTTLSLDGEDIRNHLIHSEKCALMAATIGLEVDKRIALYSRVNLTKGIILDACASTAIEWLCDSLEEEIRGKAKNMGYKITSRFSPGYGDFPIEIQKDVVEVLKAYERIGLTVNESHIMIPRKSVTAVIGFQKVKSMEKNHKCSRCNQSNCLYRKSGNDNGQ